MTLGDGGLVSKFKQDTMLTNSRDNTRILGK